MASVMGSVENFLDDIEQFFYGRRLTYVDVGAFRGEVFAKVKASRLKVREAHLVEPNPESFATLKTNLAKQIADRNVHVHQLALGAQAGQVRLRRAQDMTKVVSEGTAREESLGDDSIFGARCTTLDELSACFSEPHVSLLKVDVEGFETQVLQGATRLLSEQRIDMLYIEAGMNPEGTQQAYFRDIDDILLKYGYRLFRIYEQTTEWIVDSPLLRRVNLAYMSAGFAKENPYRLTQELLLARRQAEEAQASTELLKREVDNLRSRLTEAEGAASLAGKAASAREASLLQEAFARQRQDLQTALADEQQRCRELERQVEQARTWEQEMLKAKAEAESLRQLFQGSQAELQAAEQDLARLQRAVSGLEAQRLSQGKDIADVRASNDLLARDLDRFKADLAQSEKVRRAAQEMMAEVLQLFDELRLSERRAQSDARTAHFREERTRRRLAHRIGTVVLENARSPLGWLRMPIALGRMYSDYRQDKAAGLLQPLSPAPDGLQFRRNRLAAVPKSHWQMFGVPASDTSIELWVTPLCAVAGGSAMVEFETPSEALHGQLLRSPMASLASTSLPVSTPIPLALLPGQKQRLLALRGDASEVRFRKSRGAACALKFELLPATRHAAHLPDVVPHTSQPAQSAIASERLTESRAALPSVTTGSVPAAGQAVQSRPVDDPKRMKSAIIWQAFQMISEGHVDKGIDFATRNARDFVRPAISLLHANRVVGDDELWLKYLNEYIAQFRIEPVTLSGQGDSLFARLSTRPLPRIEHGPLITVIMPAFNADRTLAQAAQSILNQTWMPLELIIVDDFSSDGTWQVIERLKRSDSRVKAIRNRANVGPYVSKNLALSLASGAFVTGHDADDWAHPQRLALHVQEMVRSEGKIKASMTRMLRLNEAGYFGHFAKEGKTSDDGALRDAAISCMFDAAYMRKRLGHWDCVRFGADSELIARSECLLGNGFVKLRQLAMLCLDVEGSLTNDPVHGVSKLHGISPTRRFYREQWSDWHQSIDLENAYLPFPHEPRRFAAPQAAVVPASALKVVVEDLEAARCALSIKRADRPSEVVEN